jgi:sulfatase maturation enzyme AslB (radical SAM superfamily)
MTKQVIKIVDYHQRKNNNHLLVNKHIDDGLLDTCLRPFDTLCINQYGETYICVSPAWLPQSIGTILDYNNIYDFINNDIARSIRTEIILNKYTYCNHTLCNYIKPYTNIIKEATELDELHKDSIVTWLPYKLIFDFDYTCNFLCPSCRTELVNDNIGPMSITNKQLVDKIKTVLLSQYTTAQVEMRWAGGEPFVSNAYQELWEYIVTLNNQNIQHVIQTNGSYIHKRIDILTKMLPSIKEIRVSFDAGTSETYSKLRKNGNWKQLLKNCAILRKLISEVNPNTILQADFVVQYDNYNEIPQYITIAEAMGFDKICLNKMWNWGRCSDEEFKRIDVNNVSHAEYNNLMTIVSEAKLNSKVEVGL